MLMNLPRLWILFFLALAVFPTPGCRQAPCEGMNVLLIVVDTLRPDRTTPYGHLVNTTPELKRLADKGVVFETVQAQASFTMASVGTLLTSTFPHHHGAARHPSVLESRNVTLAEVLRDAGYRTSAFVCNPLLAEDSGFDQGFDEYVHLEEKTSNGAAGLTDRAISWLGDRNRGNRPFFLWLHYLDPHFPYLERPGFRSRPKSVAGRKIYRDLLKGKQAGTISAGKIFFRPGLPPEAVEEAVQAYDCEIAWTDHHLGRLLRALDDLGLDENTLVVFTSDHGESLSEHEFYFCHGFSVHEEAVRVPLVIRVPGGRKGRRVRTPVALLDVMPTLVNLTGATSPVDLLGQDLSHHLLEASQENSRMPAAPALPRALFAESEPRYLDRAGRPRYPEREGRIHLDGDRGKWRSVREGKYKLIRIPRKDGNETLLYDIVADPGETRNLAEALPREAKRLEAMLDRWLADPEARESVTRPGQDEAWAERLRSIGYTR